MAHTEFKPGQTVRCKKDGKTYTVIEHIDCQVFVYELCGGHIHPAHLTAA